MNDEQVLRRPIGWWLKEADARLDAAFDMALADHEVDRRAWQVLATLARSSTSRADVVMALSAFDRPAVVDSVVEDLRSRGWVTESDSVLRLTPDGARKQEALAPLVERVRNQVTGALPDGDYATLIRLLARLVAALPKPDRRVPALGTHDPNAFVAPLREQFEVLLDDHRQALHGCLDDVSEEEARLALVPSKTTLLGLVKHATFVELVWFNEAITGRSRADIGCPGGPDESFDLDPSDTIESVRASYRDACDASRAAARELSFNDVVHGNRRGPLPMRWIYLHMLRELAQHCGHADILREQIRAGRDAEKQV